MAKSGVRRRRRQRDRTDPALAEFAPGVDFAHHRILAKAAKKPVFQAGFRIRVLDYLHAVREREAMHECVGVEDGVEIDPFAAVPRPWLATVGFLDPGSQQCLLQRM